ncbi:hypothetical protein [Maribacter polysaccharolyticus]|uniref:hypothetical protein n=1 Tax=Maribacter polysaccharolyticus TaxID=3020831 RepID=UPI00237F96F9|nr:hypothetical protein [Maribacter polysaccharolyticus]MDE3744000.1 hypothetical protein [Maribacter polysaccharolyticus]
MNYPTQPSTDLLQNVSFTASVIAINLFEELHQVINNGVMATHERISLLAIKFEEKFGHITEWETFIDKLNKKLPKQDQYCDWESFLIEFAKRETKNL